MTQIYVAVCSMLTVNRNSVDCMNEYPNASGNFVVLFRRKNILFSLFYHSINKTHADLRIKAHNVCVELKQISIELFDTFILPIVCLFHNQ